MSVVGTLRSKWAYQPLGVVFDVVGGGTPSKQSASYYGGEIPWATIRDMQSSRLSATEHTITEDGLASSSARLIPAGEVIMASRVGLGKASILMQDTAINQDIRALIPRKATDIDRMFALYWLQSVADKIIAAGTGATVQGIKLPFIKSLSFPVISIDEQKRIVAKLDQAFAALDRARANAEANLADARSLFDSALRDHLNGIATGEPNRSLAEMCTEIVDCEHKTAPVSTKGYPSIRTPNIGRGVLNLDGVNRVSEETYREWTKRAVPEPGDLIMAREAPAGNVAVIHEGELVCLGQRTLLIKPNHATTHSPFMAHLLLHPVLQERLLSKSAGATVQHVNMKDIRLLPMPQLPPLGMQQQLMDVLERIRDRSDKLVHIASARLADIAALRQSLLQAAFSGQLS